MLYDIIILDSFMFFYMMHNCVTMIVTYDVTLASNPKSKIIKINKVYYL